MQDRPLDRREFLKRTGYLAGGVAALGGAGALAWRAGAQPPMVLPSQSKPGNFSDLHIRLVMAPAAVSLFPGTPTDVWQYTGTVISGRSRQLEPIPGSYLGPTIHVARGNRLRVRMENALPEATITHWHGLDVPEDQDGHPRFAVLPGEVYNYDFTVNERAGLYWYHPHPDMRTAAQVVKGLAGLIRVTDEHEAKFDLPSGEYEIPLVIQDRTFDSNNQIAYAPGALLGYLGNQVLVNGFPALTKTCRTRCYRLRIINGSNARTYKLAWADGTPITVIGTEGGLLEAPVTRPYVMLTPGERLDVWADFSAKTVGSQMILRSLAWTPGGVGGGGQAPVNGAAMTIATFNIAAAASEYRSLPPYFGDFETLTLDQATNAGSPRIFQISYILSGGQPVWLLNGAVFDMNTTLPNENMPRNTVEVWEIRNTLASPVMPHPIHFHGRHFQVLQRIGPTGGANLTAYNTVNQGFINAAWKDTVLVMPGETVRLLVRTSDFPGLYVYHCHLLEHEDMGMMRNFRILA